MGNSVGTGKVKCEGIFGVSILIKVRVTHVVTRDERFGLIPMDFST